MATTTAARTGARGSRSTNAVAATDTAPATAVVPTTAAVPARSSRGRRPARPSGEDRERAILATAERLLSERGFDGFSVDDLARGAGLSRPTFYFYFASKEAVVLSLLDAVIDQAMRATPPVDPAVDRVGSWRAIIATIVDVFDAHRAVAVAAVQAQPGSAEIRALWSAAMQRWVDQTAVVIEAERARGAAAAGIAARDLAIALNLMNERVLTAAFTGEQPAVDVDAVTDTLLAVWLPAVYGTATPA